MSLSFNTDGNSEFKVRKAAVAGSFYTANANKLKSDIVEYLNVKKTTSNYAQLLVSPHAGYIFSGPVAGYGFAHINPTVTTVFLLGPSHYIPFSGICLSSFTHYETPLGKVNVDQSIIKKLFHLPYAQFLKDAEEPEHSLEVQIPFLQIKLNSNFKIVPIIIGSGNLEKVAEELLPFINNEHTIVVASSDLSHYLSQVNARKIDNETIKNIIEFKFEESIEACGDNGILVLMHLAKLLNLKPTLLDSRTSHETSPENSPPNRVVGYASIAYFKDENSKSLQKLTKEDERFLLSLARKSLSDAVNGVKGSIYPEIPETFKAKNGCFVTLTINKNLRGCIGYIEPIKPLSEAIIDNAKNAALHDHRFPPVTSNELGKIHIEISILTKPIPINFLTPNELLEKITPGKDGIILELGTHCSTFLPQVWEHLPDKIQFLEHLSLKAGMSKDGWKQANVKKYEVIVIEE